MRTYAISSIVAGIASIGIAVGTAQAAGLADMHKTARVNGKTCMIDHWHNGQSGAWRSEAKARSVAIRSWKGLVRAEYGNAWTSFRASIHKRWNCKKLSDGQTSCHVMSRPCRY